METCTLCRQAVVCGHTISIDNGRRAWRLCCLCTAELIGRLDAREPVS